MKKILTLMLAAMLMLSAGLCRAESAGNVTSVYYDSTLRFDMKIPEGYELQTDRDGMILAMCLKGGRDNYDIDILVCPDDTYSEFSRFNDMTDERLAREMAELSEGYNNPSVSVLETSAGTKLIRIDENGSEMDYVEIIGLYNGYIIDVYILADDGREVTEEDIRTALDFCSGWSFVNIE